MHRFNGSNMRTWASARWVLAAAVLCSGCGDDSGFGYAALVDAGSDSSTDDFDGGCGTSTDCGLPDGDPVTLPADSGTVDAATGLAPGDLYTGCASDTDCTSGACIDFNGRNLCTETCTAAQDCQSPAGADALPYCADLPGFDVCVLACPPGQACPDGTQCLDGTCLPAPATCSDGMANEGETDVDCGGPDCAPCAPGAVCLAATDCISGTCACPGLTCVLMPLVCE